MVNNWFWHENPPAKGSYNSDNTVVIHWGRIILTALIIIVALIFLFGSHYNVNAGHVGVVTRFGAVNRTGYQGFNWKWPIIEHVADMSVQTQLDQADAAAASSDLQKVTATIAVNYHLDPAYAVQVYQLIGTNYKDVVLTPAVQNTFKGTTSQYTAEMLIKNREEVRQAAEKSIQSQMASYHIIVDNFNIVNFDFGPEYNQAIEQKQVAQQGVETAKQKLAQAQVDAQTAVAQAQGIADAQVVAAKAQAQANTLITQSLTPELLQYQYIQKVQGVQTVFLPSGSNFLLPLPDMNQPK